MRQNVGFFLVGFLSILLLTACGDSSQITVPTVLATNQPVPTSTATPQAFFSPEMLASVNPEEILLQKDIEPTFSRPEAHYPFGRVPDFTLLADGTLVYVDESANSEEQHLLQVNLSPEDTSKIISEILSLGFAKLESYTEMCKRQEDDSEQCIADAAFTILRGRLTSGQLREVKIYADFANEPAIFGEILAYLDNYQHPAAERFRPEAASLFFSPLQGQVSEEVFQSDFLNDKIPGTVRSQPWATYLEGEELEALMSELPRNMGDFIFEIDGKLYNVYLIPWLPSVDYRAVIQAEFPAPTPEPSVAQIFNACPIALEESASKTPGLIRLAYTRDSKIWIWNEGQDPVALVQAEAVNQVLLTKDGRNIVFILQSGDGPGEIWAVGSNGENLRQLAGVEITGGVLAIDFSWDGQLIAFTHKVNENNAELWVARMDGSGSSRLVSTEDLKAIFNDFENPQGLIPFSVRWIPGTHQLMYDAYPTGDGIYIYVQDQVWTVDADTGEKRNLLAPGVGGSVSFSPNGEMMVIVSTDRLQLMEVGGNQPRQIDIPYAAIGFGEYYFYPTWTWSPDSTFFLLALPFTNQGTQDEPVAIWQVPVDGSAPAKLAEFSGFAPSFQFSPDLSRVAYWRAGPQSNDRDLHLANVDGSEDVHYVTSFVLEFLSWDADSQHFAYSYGQPGTSVTMLGGICAVPQKITDYHAYPTWLQDGRFLLLHDQDGRLELSLAEKSGEIRTLIQPEDYDNYAFVVLQAND